MAKQFFSLGLILALAMNSSAVWSQSATRTFVKSFNLDGATEVRLDLPQTVDIRPWDGNTLRFEISVTLPPQCNAAMLNELANVGRYNMNSKTEGSILVIDAPNLARQIKVKGQEMKETIAFTLHVPKQVSILPAPEGNRTAAKEE
jgi:hypothetical protein